MLPALAVARELRARGQQVRFVGVERGMEAKLVPAADFPIEWIEIGGLNRVGFRQTLATLGELPFSIWQAARILDRAAPAADGAEVWSQLPRARVRRRWVERFGLPGLHRCPQCGNTGARSFLAASAQ